MSTSGLLRTGGTVLLVGSVLGFVGTLIQPSDPGFTMGEGSPLFIPAAALTLIAGLCVVVSFPAVFARIAGVAGRLGLIGFVALMITACVFGIFGPLLSLTVEPWIVTIPNIAAAQPPVSVFAFYIVASVIALIAAVTFGIASLRSRVFPSWVGYLLIAAGLLNLVGFAFPPSAPAIVQNLGGLGFFAALACFGYSLVMERSEQSTVRLPDIGDTNQPKAA